MNKMIEVTCWYDSEETRVSEFHKTTMLIDPERIETISEFFDESHNPKGSKVDFKPGVTCMDDNENITQGQRTIMVTIGYSEIRNIVENLRGIVKAT